MSVFDGVFVTSGVERCQLSSYTCDCREVDATAAQLRLLRLPLSSQFEYPR